MSSKLAMLAALSDDRAPVLQRPVVRAVLAGSAAVVAVMTVGSSLYAYRRRHAHALEAAEDEDAFATPLLRGDASKSLAEPSLSGKSYAVTEQDSRTTTFGKADASLHFASYAASHGLRGARAAEEEEDSASRPQQPQPTSASAASRARPDMAMAAASALTGALAAGASTGGDDAHGAPREELYNTEIVARTKLLGTVRALLRQVNDDHGLKEDSEPTDSDTTDVSFNYHIAGELEDEAREELMRAMGDYEHAQEVSGAAADASPEDGAARVKQKLVYMLSKMIEYLDISVEREKLRLRREALHFRNGTSTPPDEEAVALRDMPPPPSSLGANGHRAVHARPAYNVLDGAPYHGMEDDEDEDEGDTDAAAQLRAELMQHFLAGHGNDDGNGGGGDRAGLGAQLLLSQYAAMLRQAGAGNEALEHALRGTHPRQSEEEDEMSEHGWDEGAEGSEGEEEAAFMAYLQQPDSAERFYSRAAMRAARRRPWDDVVVIDRDGHTYADAVVTANGPAAGNATTNEDEEDEWVDESEEDEEENDNNSNDEEEGQDVEEWTAQERAEFEADLVARIAEMANAWGVTEAMAERELLASEAARVARHAKRTTDTTAAAQPGAADAAATATAEEEDVWEDEEEASSVEKEAAANAQHAGSRTRGPHARTATHHKPRHAPLRAHGRH